MASSGKKGKKTKGKVVPWQEFFVTQAPASVPVRKGSSWADEVENDEFSDARPRPALPSGPRASRDIDDSAVPHQPPYIAYVSNLPYDIEEEDLRELFADMQIESLRLPRDDRDGDGGRAKGFGYVEFTERGGLVGAISIGDPVVKARRVRIEVANENERRRGGGSNRDRDRGDSRSDVMHDPERTTGNWRQGGGTGPPPLDSPSSRGSSYRNNDRDRDSNSEVSNRPGGWRESTERTSFRDNRSNSRDDRPSFRDDRSSFRNDKGGFNREGGEKFDRDSRSGYREDRERFNRDDRSGGFKDKDFGERRAGGGFGPRRNFDDKGKDDFRREDSEKGAEPRTRPRLQLAPRSIPLEPVAVPPPVENQSVKEETPVEKPAAQNIFGSAKPVDTASRERQIESRLEKEREFNTDSKAGGDSKETEGRLKKEVRDEDSVVHKSENQTAEDRRTNSKEHRSQNRFDNRHCKPDKREVKDTRTDEERMPKLKEQQAPNFVASNKYAYLECEHESD